MSARPLVAGNWKMNLDHVEAIHLVQQIGVLLHQRAPEHVSTMVIPPFTDLRSVSSVVDADRLRLSIGAQHASAFDRGPHTGEVSLSMLRRLGVSAVIVGHSERRAHYYMDDAAVRATFEAVQRAEMTAILCVGEDLEAREAGRHAAVVLAQLRAALESASATPFVVAYEPVWAIGTGVVAEVDQVAEMMSIVRAALPSAHSESTPVLYGGSVSAESAPELARDGALDGFLVGGASLRAEEFCAIVAALEDCYPRTR
jgi:triosephosphate isomerase